jgi:DNA-binding XRE family transcriptional regulator
MPATSKPPLSATLAAFGARVRARRLELGWSQEDAAHEIGVHWTYLGQVERGQRSAPESRIFFAWPRVFERRQGGCSTDCRSTR